MAAVPTDNGESCSYSDVGPDGKRIMTISNLRSGWIYGIEVDIDPMFNITSQLSKVSLTNQKIGGVRSDATIILPGSSYEVTLVPDTGYDISTVQVTVNGEIKHNVFDELTNKIQLSNVRGDIKIIANAVTSSGITTYTVTKSLSNVIMGNGTKKVNDGESYTSTLNARSGYTLQTVNVTMGGTPVQNAYNNGYVHIEEVQGDIAITSKATKTLPPSPEPSTAATAVIFINPEHFADTINESITIGQPWEHTFEIPTFVNTNAEVLPAYEYVSNTLTMANGGTIQRDGNRFYTNNVTGNITGEITYKVVDNAVYGYIYIGVWGAYGTDDDRTPTHWYNSFSMRGNPGHTATFDYVEDGYTLDGSFVQACRNPHFSGGTYTMDSGDITSREYVANGSLDWNPTTRKLTVKKPFFRTLNEEYGFEKQIHVRVCMGVNSKTPHPPMQSRIEFLCEVGSKKLYTIDGDTGEITISIDHRDPHEESQSFEGSMYNWGLSRNANIPYGQAYTQRGVEGYYIIPYTGYVLDNSKGTKGITVIDNLTGQGVPFTFTPNQYIHQNVLTINNVVKPLIISFHCKPDPSITTAKLEFQGENIPGPSGVGPEVVENVSIGDTWSHSFNEGTVDTIELWMYGDYSPDNDTSHISYVNKTLIVSNITGNIGANVTFK